MSKEKEYPFKLECSFGFLLSGLAERMFSSIIIPHIYKSSILSLAEKGHIVYTHGPRSRIDAMLINCRFQKEGLPVPWIVFSERFLMFQDVSKLTRLIKGLLKRVSTPFQEDMYRRYMLDSNSASILFLEREDSAQAIDTIVELLKIQQLTDKPIFMVPQRIVYAKSPLKVKDASKTDAAQHASLQKMFTLIRAKDKGFIENGEPINLKEKILKARNEAKFLDEIAKEIRGELIQGISSLGSNISGATIKERSFLIQKTIEDPLLKSFLRSYSMKQGIPADLLSDKVQKMLDQIAADLSPTYINMFNKTLTWIFNDIFDGLDIDRKGLETVARVARKGSIVYVPCHKSHIDYLVLSYCLFHNWMSVPLIAAGVNLSFFPMGYIFRKGGAFFMRRTFKGNLLYSEVFAAYIRTILGESIPIEFFIEGTRSRSGKLMLPKKGLLSMIVRGWDAGATRDVIFVPVYVGYDTVLEENSYIREMKGAPKKKENLFALIKARNFLKRRYGKVYIRFAKPISLREYMKGKPKLTQMDEVRRKDLYDGLARIIARSIYSETVATPFAILCAVLMNQTSAMEENYIKDAFHLYVEYLEHMGYNKASSFNNMDGAFTDALNLAKKKRLISAVKGEEPREPDLIEVPQDRRLALEYYKNTVLNLFVPISLVANVLIRYPHGIEKRRFMEEIKILSSLVENEFFLDTNNFEKTIDFMLKKNLVSRSGGMFYVPPDKKDYCLMFVGLIENYLESYLAVALSISRVEGKKDVLRAINSYASRMFKKGTIKRPEALCLPNYKGALDTFKAKGILDQDNKIVKKEELDFIANEIEEYLED